MVLAGVLLGLFFAYQPYIKLVYKEARYGFASLKPTARFFSYWAKYYNQLKENPENGTYDFEWIAKEPQSQLGLDDYELGALSWHRGDFTTAVSSLEDYHRNEETTEQSLFWLAMSYLRLAETENCLNALMSPDRPLRPMMHRKMCTLPLTLHHTQTEYSRSAADVFQRLLDEFDHENDLYRWLLNFCYMIDQTEQAGLSRIKGTHLITAADYDNDGWMDLFAGRPLAGNPMGDYVLLRNTGGGRFENVTTSVGLLPLDDDGQRKRSLTWAWADVDTDGDLDLFVATLGGADALVGEPVLPPRFYINEGDRFVDRTEAFGLSA